MIKINYDEEKKASKKELLKLMELPDYIILPAYYIKYQELKKISTPKAKKIIKCLSNFYELLDIEEVLYKDFEYLEDENILKIMNDKMIKDNISFNVYNKDVIKLKELLTYNMEDIIFLINCNKINNYTYYYNESIITLYYNVSLCNITYDDIINEYDNLLDTDIAFLDCGVYNLTYIDFDNYKPVTNTVSKTYDYLVYELSEDIDLINTSMYYIDPKDISFSELITLENKDISYDYDNNITGYNCLTLDY